MNNGNIGISVLNSIDFGWKKNTSGLAAGANVPHISTAARSGSRTIRKLFLKARRDLY